MLLSFSPVTVKRFLALQAVWTLPLELDNVAQSAGQCVVTDKPQRVFSSDYLSVMVSTHTRTTWGWTYDSLGGFLHTSPPHGLNASPTVQYAFSTPHARELVLLCASASHKDIRVVVVTSPCFSGWRLV